MKQIVFLSMVVILSPFLALGGQETSIGSELHGAAGSQRSVVTADSLKNAKIVDPQGLPLGTVKAVEPDPKNGTIAYVVMEPGTRDRYIPVPYSAFLLTPDRRLVLDIDQGRILTAPSFTKDGRPNWSDAAWTEQIRKFWASGRTWQPAGGRIESAPLR